MFYRLIFCQLFHLQFGFPDSSAGTESAYNVGNLGAIPGLGRSPFYSILRAIFILFIISFAVHKLLSLIRSHLFVSVSISITLRGGSKRILLWCMSKNVLPMFSSRSFIVSDLLVRFLMHWKFAFLYGVRQRSNFILS